MCKDLASAGVEPVAALHVNVRGDIQPCKPVKISLPLADSSIKEHNIMILQKGKSDGFKDITKNAFAALSKHHVHLRTPHLTT